MGSKAVFESLDSSTVSALVALADARMAVNAGMRCLTKAEGKINKRVSLRDRRKAQREAIAAVEALTTFITHNGDLIHKSAMADF